MLATDLEVDFAALCETLRSVLALLSQTPTGVAATGVTATQKQHIVDPLGVGAQVPAAKSLAPVAAAAPRTAAATAAAATRASVVTRSPIDTIPTRRLPTAKDPLGARGDAIGTQLQRAPLVENQQRRSTPAVDLLSVAPFGGLAASRV